VQLVRENIVLFLSGYGFDFRAYLILSLLVFFFIFTSLGLFKSLFIFTLKFFDRHHDNIFNFWYVLAKRFRKYIFFFVAAYIATLFIPMTANVGRIVDTIALLVATFFLINLLQASIFDFATYVSNYFPRKNDKKIDRTAIMFLKVLLTVALWIVAIIFILNSWDYDITVLLGGFGIGAIIIAFSSQNMLRDIFAFFTVYTDKSYAVGDFISFDKFEGTVEEIRLRTTRIRALSGQNLVVANHFLTNHVISNFSCMTRRRLSVDIFIENDDSKVANIEKFITDLKVWFPEQHEVDGKMVNVDKDEVPELVHALLLNMTPQSMTINVVYYLNKPAIAVSRAFREKLNLEILKLLKKHNIKMVKHLNISPG
jgi:small-conductance mechanosensitive channel